MEPLSSKPALSDWEAKFTTKQMAGSRIHTPLPWLSEQVYVVKDLTDQLDPISTGGVPFYKVIAHPTPGYVVESVRNAKPHLDEFLSPGDVHVVSKELSEQDTYIKWQTGEEKTCDIISLMIKPDQIESAAEVGYADPASFAKAFRRHIGTSPSRYRQDNQ